MDDDGFDFSHIEIRDREKDAENRRTVLADGSPWVESLGSLAAVEDYFTRDAVRGRFDFPAVVNA